MITEPDAPLAPVLSVPWSPHGGPLVASLVDAIEVHNRRQPLAVGRQAVVELCQATLRDLARVRGQAASAYAGEAVQRALAVAAAMDRAVARVPTEVLVAAVQRHAALVVDPEGAARAMLDADEPAEAFAVLALFRQDIGVQRVIVEALDATAEQYVRRSVPYFRDVLTSTHEAMVALGFDGAPPELVPPGLPTYVAGWFQ